MSRLYSRRHSVQPAFGTVAELLVLVLGRMSPEALQHTLSLGTDGERLECFWHMEAYRCIMDLLPPRIVVSACVGKVGVFQLHMHSLWAPWLVVCLPAHG
jgi:hypothetical protein